MTLQKVLKPSAEFLKQYASRPRVLKYIEQMEKEFAVSESIFLAIQFYI